MVQEKTRWKSTTKALTKPTNSETEHDQDQDRLWEAETERLNDKYNLDCFSDSELDSKSDEGEEYCYEHGHETLI